MRIWGNSWLPSHWAFAVITPPFLPTDTPVKRLITSLGIWDVDFIKSQFLPIDVERILVVPLVRGHNRDVGVWHYCLNGQSTVKSGYWLGMEGKNVDAGAGSSDGSGASNSTNF